MNIFSVNQTFCNQVTVNSAACLKNSWCNSWRIYVVNAVLLKLLPELYQFRYSQSAINDNQDTNSSASNEHSSFAINTVTRFSVNLLVIAEKPDLVIMIEWRKRWIFLSLLSHWKQISKMPTLKRWTRINILSQI